MSSPLQVPQLLRDLQQISRALPRNESDLLAQGSLIRDAFVRHSRYSDAAVYLRDPRDGSLRLSAKSESLSAPATLEDMFPEEVLSRGLHEHFVQASSALDPRTRTVLPITNAREHFGLIALALDSEETSSEEEVELLRTIGFYLSTLIHMQKIISDVREGDFQIKYRLWELESLYDIGLSIASTLDLDKLAEEILLRTISLLNARRAALFLKSDGNFVLRRSFGEVISQFLEQDLAPQDAARLLDRGEAILFEKEARCIFPDCDSLIALPIRIGDEVIGILAAADRETRDGGVGPFEENDLRMLSLFANQVAIALENARLHTEALAKQAMERELELAATIQRDILPRGLPSAEGFDLGAFARPARQLGGDYHAFFEIDGKLSICVADVSGKSVPAAVLVSALHAALQLLMEQGRPLGEIATELNRHIHHWSAENKFITLILATIDRHAQTIQYVNAGHNPGYLLRGDTLEALSSHGLPIGILSQTVYRTQSRKFEPGTLLATYSDGITEAENGAGEEFGNELLENLLRENGTLSCVQLKDLLAETVDSFTGTAPQKDDQTIVLVRSL